MKPVDGYIRDKNNEGAVINTDNGALQSYKQKKNREKEIDNLRNEMADIKNMLAQLLAKSS